jgi:predicted nucleic acid-binding Zn ribbon protein
MSPYVVDNLEKVNNRRISLGLNSLEEQTLLMRKHMLDTNQKPPENLVQRKVDFLRWKKEVGWIK